MTMLLTLQTAGQSLWMAHVNRQSIYNGTLIRQITDWSLSGLSITPHAVCQCLRRNDVYDRAISLKMQAGMCGETLAFDLILEDVCGAADLLRHVYDKSGGVDGWCSFPLSPVNQVDTGELKDTVIALHRKLNRPNILITIPSFPEYSELIGELIFTGIPVNISHICSPDQYRHAAEIYIKAIERRIEAGLTPVVSAFTSISVAYLVETLSQNMTNEKSSSLSTAIARMIYKTMRALHTSQNWERAYNAGARFLRLIWVNSADEQKTKTEQFIADRLVAPLTVTSMSGALIEKYLRGEMHHTLLGESDTRYDDLVSNPENSGLNIESFADNLQKDLADLQVKTWIMLLDMLARKSASIIQN